MVANMFSHVYSMQFYSDKIIPRKMILLDIVSYIWTVFSYIASALNGNNVCMFVLFWYLFHPNGLSLSLFLFRMQYRHVAFNFLKVVILRVLRFQTQI